MRSVTELVMAALMMMFTVAGSTASTVAQSDPLPTRAATAPPGADSLWPTVAGSGIRTLDGETLRPADLEGRWILLDFWATWCAPCIAELPTLREIAENYNPEDLLVLGVSMNRSTRAAVAAWLHRQRITWTQIHDGLGFDGVLPRAFGVEALPRTVLVDPNGLVVAVDLRGPELIGTLEALIASP